MAEPLIILTEQELRDILGEFKRDILDELDKRVGAPKEEYLDVKEVCGILGISSRTFARYREEGRIIFIQRGRKIYVKRSDLDKFQEENKINCNII